MPVIKPPSDEELEEVFKPYAFELGALVYSWNHLHVQLANLFWRITGIKNGAIPFAIWQSMTSDSYQRKVLRATAEVALANDKRALDEVEWLLKTIDNEISGERNDAIHIPMMFWTNEKGTTIRPSDTANNRRATKHKGKEIVAELSKCRENADVLRKYCHQLYRALTSPPKLPWPDRPVLPHPTPGKNPNKKSRASSGKARPLPPRSVLERS